MPSFRHTRCLLREDSHVTDLSKIIGALEEQRNALESALAALRSVGTPATQRPAPAKAPHKRSPASTKRRRMSEEGRRRIAEAQRKRWAALKKSAAKKIGS